MAYATLADLATYTGAESTEPGDERLLQRASELLDTALMSASYRVDSAGAPIDATVVDALKRACCAQVEWYKATDDEIGSGGQWQSTKVAPAALVPTVSGGTAGSGRLSPKAAEALVTAGIWRHKPSAW